MLSCKGPKADHYKRHALVWYFISIPSIILKDIVQVASLGLRRQIYSAADLLAGHTAIPGVKVVWRERTMVEPGKPGYINLRSVLSDTSCRPGKGDTVVNETTGFYVVGPSESVIFLSKSTGVTSKSIWQWYQTVEI